MTILNAFRHFSTHVKHPTVLMMTLLCAIGMCFAFSRFAQPSTLDICIFYSFFILTLFLPFQPSIISCILSICSIIFFLFPSSVFPSAMLEMSVLFCSGLALATLAYFWNYLISLPIIVEISASVLIAGYYYDGNSRNTFSIFAIIFFTGACGCALRYWKAYKHLLQQKERAENLQIKQAQQLNLARTLHDDVAGSISYVIALCNTVDSMDDAKDIREVIEKVSQTLSESLASLRNNVIAPLTQGNLPEAEMPMNKDNTSMNSTNSTNGYPALCQRISTLNLRLAEAGFDGIIRCTSELDDAMSEIIAGILTELSNNIVKHGQKSYMITITSTDLEVRIFASNTIAPIMKQDQPGNGLKFLQDEVRSHGGILETYEDEGEWVTNITFPENKGNTSIIGEVIA